MLKGYKIFTMLLLFTISQSTYAAKVPALTGRVNDYAKILSAETLVAINSKLDNLESSDSTQTVVLTIDSLEGEDIEGYANKVFNTWKLGKTKLDNGILFLIAKNDRQLRIEVGRGLEGKLPDVLAGKIIRDDIVPLLKNGNWNSAVIAGIDSIIKVVMGEYSSKQSSTIQTQIDGILTIYFAIMILLTHFQKLLSKGAKQMILWVVPITGAIISLFFTKSFLLMIFSAGVGFIAVSLGLSQHSKSGSDGGGVSRSSGDSGYSGSGGSSGGGGASGRF